MNENQMFRLCFMCSENKQMQKYSLNETVSTYNYVHIIRIYILQ